MISVAIVEDDRSAALRIRECLDYISEQEKISFTIDEFPSGLAFLGNYKPIYDIVLMDIEMPEMDGMETARALRKMDRAVILIFVTNLAQYAVQGYEVEALDFILKPINKYSFAMKLNRAIARTTKRLDETVHIGAERDAFSIPVASIKYLEILGHYTVYHTIYGDYKEYGTLKDAEKKIGKSFFVRCNRCYLVNLRYIDMVKRDTVYIGKEELLISRPQKKAFLSAFSDFLGGRKDV